MPGNREYRRNQPERQDGLAVDEKHDQAADVAGEVGNLHVASGKVQRQARKLRIRQQQECSRAGAVEPVVHADDQRRREDDDKLPSAAHGSQLRA